MFTHLKAMVYYIFTVCYISHFKTKAWEPHEIVSRICVSRKEEHKSSAFLLSLQSPQEAGRLLCDYGWVPERNAGAVWEGWQEKNETKTKFLIKAQCLILKSEFKEGKPIPGFARISSLCQDLAENRLSCSARSGFLQEAADVAGQKTSPR